MARTLIFDIENTPNLGWIWELWQTDVIQVDVDWHILSFAWKWLGEKRVHAMGLPDCEDPESDYELCVKLHELFDEADIVVAHNGARFDVPKVNARMLVHGMEPPSPYKQVDTLQVARRTFKFSSNKLDDLCRELGLERKGDTSGWKTWIGCINGDEKAWRTLIKYNKQDVQILEQLYLRLRPWTKNHPNVGAIDDLSDICPRCGAAGEMISRGWTYATASRRQRFQCRACGGWCAGRNVYKTGNSYVNG
jgi:hypothetical protein